VAVADRVVEQQERDAGGQQRHQVGQQEGAAAVLVGDVREPPDVAEPDRRADRRQDEDPPGAERPRRCSSSVCWGDVPRRRAHVTSVVVRDLQAPRARVPLAPYQRACQMPGPVTCSTAARSRPSRDPVLARVTAGERSQPREATSPVERGPHAARQDRRAHPRVARDQSVQVRVTEPSRLLCVVDAGLASLVDHALGAAGRRCSERAVGGEAHLEDAAGDGPDAAQRLVALDDQRCLVVLGQLETASTWTTSLAAASRASRSRYGPAAGPRRSGVAAACYGPHGL
jgi:hypothetical protein